MLSNNKQSLVDRILKASLELARMKERNTYETFLHMKRKCVPHKLMQNMFRISSKEVKGKKVWKLSPLKDESGLTVLFLHGGAYVTNMTPAHWFFIGAMVQKCNCSVLVPDYPLAPENHPNDVFSMILALYQDILETKTASNLIVMGDSAGGGMALALCQLLHEKGMEQARELFLLSPWLDVHMNNPDIPELDPKDPILNIQGLIDSGVSYAGSMDRQSYLVSPLFGSLSGLPPIRLYVGTHDVLLADARKFMLKAEKEGIVLHYHEIKGLLHDGMLYPTPEGKSCREMIFSAINDLEFLT